MKNKTASRIGYVHIVRHKDKWRVQYDKIENGRRLRKHVGYYNNIDDAEAAMDEQSAILKYINTNR